MGLVAECRAVPREPIDSRISKRSSRRSAR
jgi:hypothetical protein